MTAAPQQRPSGLLAWVAARPRAQTFLPLGLYALFTVLWIGRGVVAHPEANVLGDADRDKTILMWSFRWWPHAVAAGHDPFNANVVWVPHGVDLAWVTSSPALSFILAPLTLTIGPVFAYNVAALAAPPLAAWTTYLLARRLTGNLPASLLAGFLFGFSPYLVSQDLGHLNLSFVCLVPLAGLLAVRFFEGSIGRWKYAALLALVLIVQFGISTEIFATLTFLGAICFGLAWWLLDVRRRLKRVAGYTALAYLACGAVVSPYLVHAFDGTNEAPVRPHAYRHALNIANLLFPTQTTWLRPPLSAAVAQTFAYKIDEIGGYVGIPLLILVGVIAFTSRQGRMRRGILFLLLAALAADVLAVGPRVRVASHVLFDGVWAIVQHLPALGVAIPIRLAMYAALFVALAVALWLAQPGRRPWHWLLAGLAVVSFLPNPTGSFWTSPVRQSTFFTSGAYRSALRPGDRALVLPFASRESWSMLWQAETDFRFSMVGGHIGQTLIPPECPWALDYVSLSGGEPPGGAAGFRKFLLAHGTTVVIEGPGTSRRESTLISSSLPDVPRFRIADATVYRIPPGLSPALPRNAPPLPVIGVIRFAPARAVCGG